MVQHDLNQIQYSKFLKVDSELDRLDELSADVHLKYIHAEELERIKHEYLSHKAKFGQQMQHLKAKGSMLHILQRADREIVARLEDFLVQKRCKFREEEADRVRRADVQDKIVRSVTGRSGFDRQVELHRSQTPLKSEQLFDAQQQAKVEQKLRLMSTLQRQFVGEYLPKTNNNYYLALKKQTAQVESCVHGLTKQKYEARRSQSMAVAHQYLCDRYRPFGAKEAVVDAGIEGDIRFFNHNYTARQAEIFDVKRQIRSNARRLKYKQMMTEEPLAKAMSEYIQARFPTVTCTVSPDAGSDLRDGTQPSQTPGSKKINQSSEADASEDKSSHGSQPKVVEDSESELSSDDEAPPSEHSPSEPGSLQSAPALSCSRPACPPSAKRSKVGSA